MSESSPAADAGRAWGRRAWGVAFAAAALIPALGPVVGGRPVMLSLSMAGSLVVSGVAIACGMRWLGKALFFAAVLVLLVWSFIGHTPPTYQVAGAVLTLVAFGGGLLVLTQRSHRP